MPPYHPEFNRSQFDLNLSKASSAIVKLGISVLYVVRSDRLSSPAGASWWSEIVDAVRDWSKELANRCLVMCLLVSLLGSLIVVLKPPVVYQFLWYQEVKLQDQFFDWRRELAATFGQRQAAHNGIVI